MNIDYQRILENDFTIFDYACSKKDSCQPTSINQYFKCKIFNSQYTLLDVNCELLNDKEMLDRERYYLIKLSKKIEFNNEIYVKNKLFDSEQNRNIRLNDFLDQLKNDLIKRKDSYYRLILNYTFYCEKTDKYWGHFCLLALVYNNGRNLKNEMLNYDNSKLKMMMYFITEKQKKELTEIIPYTTINLKVSDGTCDKF